MESAINLFLNQIMERSPLQFKNARRYVEGMRILEKEGLERRLQYFLYQGETYETIVDGYLEFCLYFMRERKYFVQNGTYRYTSFKEAASLYKDSVYMRNYMIGMSIAVYLWKIQRENMRFFREKCKMLSRGGKYLEVGPGHGEYLITAIESVPFDSYLAVDISYTATEMTKSFLEFALKESKDMLKKVKVENKNFFDFESKEKFDAIVMSEIIEHVENPLDFLVQVKNLAKENAFIYLSTAINSPFPDHLYHFHNKDEVYSLINKAGLKIVDEVFSTTEGITLEKALRKNYDIIVGFILTV